MQNHKNTNLIFSWLDTKDLIIYKSHFRCSHDVQRGYQGGKETLHLRWSCSASGTEHETRRRRGPPVYSRRSFNLAAMRLAVMSPTWEQRAPCVTSASRLHALLNWCMAGVLGVVFYVNLYDVVVRVFVYIGLGTHTHTCEVAAVGSLSRREETTHRASSAQDASSNRAGLAMDTVSRSGPERRARAPPRGPEGSLHFHLLEWKYDTWLETPFYTWSL